MRQTVAFLIKGAARQDILVKVREATRHYLYRIISNMIRVPVVNPDNSPAMPCKASRARCMVQDGLAVGKRNKLGIYYIHWN